MVKRGGRTLVGGLRKGKVIAVEIVLGHAELEDRRDDIRAAGPREVAEGVGRVWEDSG